MFIVLSKKGVVYSMQVDSNGPVKTDAKNKATYILNNLEVLLR